MARIQQIYDFIAPGLPKLQVERIIRKADYDPLLYSYEARVDNDGWLVKGQDPMSTTTLRNAATQLRIKVEIYSAIGGGFLPSGYVLRPVLSDAATTYSVSIDLSIETIEALDSGNYLLYGFKAVKSSNGDGAPVIWFRTTTYSTNTDVSWEVQYQAYTSKSEIVPNGKIVATFATDIDLDQTLEVLNDKGTGVVVHGGTEGAVSILNKTPNTVRFTTGISQVVEGKANPMCAFPLFGKGLDVIAPIEKILLMFTTTPKNTGTVVFQAYSSSVLIDLTGAPNNHRTVAFDIDKGWSWDGGVWAKEFQANQDLVPLLIISSAQAERQAAARDKKQTPTEMESAFAALAGRY